MYLSKSLIWKNFVGVHDSLRIKHLQTRYCKFERFFIILYFLACLICFIRKTAESDFEKWIKFLFLNPRPCSAEILPLDLEFSWHQKKSMHACYADEILERRPTCDCWSTHRGRAQCHPSPPGCTGESWCWGACSRLPRVHNQPPGLHPSLPTAPRF